MTKRSVRGEFNTFVKGLITEASPLNFPEQAAKDIVNFELNRDGTLYRRLGFGLEPTYEYETTSLTEADKLISYVWEEPAYVSRDKFLVTVAGSVVKFYSLASSSVTASGYLGEITLSISPVSVSKSSLSSVDGRLVIATGLPDVVVIEYNPNTQTFTQSTGSLKSRDIWGISVPESDADPSWRPSVNNERHRYNLYNAGWAIERLSSPTTYGDPARYVFDGLGQYPSEDSSVWTALVTIPEGSVPLERLNYDSYKGILGARAAPIKGHFIIDMLNRGASRREALSESAAQNPNQEYLNPFAIPDDRTDNGAKVVSEHSGRIFFAGFGSTSIGDFRSPDLSGYVAFSRLIRNRSDVFKCYQEGDPTSREASDIVDTDGGIIRISGVSGITNLISLGSNLVICATNGIWSIEGGSDYGFTASNYKVTRVSEFGVSSGNSVVTDGSSIFYWGETGIYVVSRNQFGDLEVKSITENSIEGLYLGISESARNSVKGVYDKVQKKIRWVYPETSWSLFTESVKEIVLDLSIGAFYLNEVDSYSQHKILDVFITPSFRTVDETTSVLSVADEVLVGTESVITDIDVKRVGLQSVKYLVANNNSGLIRYTVGWYSDQTFKDWYDVDDEGVDAKAYLLTGAITGNDSAIHKQSPILVVHMERTENALDSNFELANQSGCFIRVLWDFASSISSNKFSPLFQAYRLKRAYIPASPGPYDNGFELMTSRNKLRGRGRALSIYMESEPSKDCKIVGWNLSMNGNSVA